MHKRRLSAKFAIIFSLFFEVAFGHTDETFNLTLMESPNVSANYINVAKTGMSMRMYAHASRLLFLSTPAGDFSFAGAFPGFKKLGSVSDSLTVLEDGQVFKIIEHSFLCERNGLKLAWMNVYKIFKGIHGVMVTSTLVNLSDEKDTGYQYWVSSSIRPEYYSETGRHVMSVGGVQRFKMQNWVYFQLNDEGGVGMIANKSRDIMLFGNMEFKSGDLWGIRLQNQLRPELERNQESVLRFVVFFATNPVEAQALYVRIRNENIFPELWGKP